jgi:hypothetical protein
MSSVVPQPVGLMISSVPRRRDLSGLTRFEERQDGQHPPVIGSAFGQVELGEDAADVFLDRALRCASF